MRLFKALGLYRWFSGPGGAPTRRERWRDAWFWSK